MRRRAGFGRIHSLAVIAGLIAAGSPALAQTGPVRPPSRPKNVIDRSNLPQNPESPAVAEWPPAGPAPAFKTLPPSPRVAQTVSTQFTAATFADTSAFPPDTMGMAGPTQFLATLNSRFRVFSKTGVLGGLDVNSDSFFSTVMSSASGTFTSDPRVRFDRLSGRWFISMIDVPAGSGAGPNRILIAVSNGATISSSSDFKLFYFVQDQAGGGGDAGLFADYPTLGIDANALYIGCDMFTTSAFVDTTGFVIKKSLLLSGAGGDISASPEVFAFRGLTGGGAAGPESPQGVDNYDPAATKGYFIGADIAAFGLLQIREITWTGGTPSVSANISLTVPTTSLPFRVRHQGNTGGANGRLDASNDRLFGAHLRNGSLWAAHNINVNIAGVASAIDSRSAARWYEIGNLGPTPTLLQSGTLFDSTATNPRNYFYPSIMVSGQGHVAIGTSSSGNNEHINGFTTGRLAGDPLGTLQTVAGPYTNSTTAYNPPGDSGGATGRRWGDYSYTCVDPFDDMTMWTIQQFCDATNSYGCRVAKLLAPPPATPSNCSSSQIAQNQLSVNVTITGTSSSGSGFFDPGPGFLGRLQVTVSGGVTVNSFSYVDPTHITMNLSTMGAPLGAKDITVTNPDGQVLTGTALFTVTTGAGAPACTVTPSGTATNASPIVFTMTFSQAVTGFGAGGITVTNGTAGTISTLNSSTYTIPVTPLGQGAVTCSVNAAAANAVSDNQTSLASNLASVVYDTILPTCTVSGPVSPSNVSPITFSITFSEPVLTFVLGDVSATNGTVTGLSGSGASYVAQVTPSGQGLVTCSVAASVAHDAAGNNNTASNLSSVSFDNVPPTVTVSGSGAFTNVTPVVFTITLSESVTGLAIGGFTITNGTPGTLTPTSGTTYSLPVTPLADGTVSVQVTAGAAQDAAGNGNTLSNIGSATFDSTPPTAPGSPTASPNPNNTGSFALTWAVATDTGGSGVASYTLQRSSDGGSTWPTQWLGLTTAASLDSGLPQGSYRYRVRAVDNLGNTGPFSAPSAAMVVDTTAPGAPGTPVGTPNPTPGNFTLTWSAAADTGGSGVATYTVLRSLNGGAFTSIATGVVGTSLPQNGLSAGAYRFEVQAVDGAGNTGPLSGPSPAVVIDTTAPDTTILIFPPNPSSAAGATFTFAATVAGCTFETKLDGAPFVANGTSTVRSYTGLGNGSHTFQVRAIDSAGNTDSSPASFTWTIDTSSGDTTPPDTILTSHPTDPTASTNAAFTFLSTEPGGTFEVKLDGGAFASNGASSTKSYSALAPGTHTFAVRAIDAASNVDPTPASFTWTIVAPPSDSTAPLLNLFGDAAAISNWVLSSSDPLVVWAVDATPSGVPGGPFRSSPSSLNYNNGTDFDSPGLPNSGTATSPPMSLAGLTGPRLKFYCNYQTETSGTAHDLRTVQVSSDGFATLLVDEQLSTTPGSGIAGPCAAMGTWHEHVIPLNPAWGTVQVRYRFDTQDAALNNFEGWFIDDFEVSDLLVSGVNQFPSGSTSPVSVGGTTTSNVLSVGATLSADATGSVRLEVEVQPVGTPFTGIPTATATASGAGTPLSLQVTLPGDGAYHWQVRTVNGLTTSGWMSFGLNPESVPDFIVNTGAPATGGGGGGCGALGMDAALLVLLLRLSRRRSAAGRTIPAPARRR